MVHPMHIWCNKYQSKNPVESRVHFYIGMVKLRQHDTQALVQHDHPDSGSCYQYGNHGKYGPENAFARVMPVSGCSINISICMMYHMELPHPFYFVLDVEV